MADDRSKDSSSSETEPGSGPSDEQTPGGAAQGPPQRDGKQEAGRRQWLDQLIARLDDEDTPELVPPQDDSPGTADTDLTPVESSTELEVTRTREAVKPPSFELEAMDGSTPTVAVPLGARALELQALGQLELEEPSSGPDDPTRPGLSIEAYLNPPPAGVSDLLELELPGSEESAAGGDERVPEPEDGEPRTSIYSRRSQGEDEAPEQLSATDLSLSEVAVAPDWAQDPPTKLRRPTESEEPTRLRESSDDEAPDIEWANGTDAESAPRTSDDESAVAPAPADRVDQPLLGRAPPLFSLDSTIEGDDPGGSQETKSESEYEDMTVEPAGEEAMIELASEKELTIEAADELPARESAAPPPTPRGVLPERVAPESASAPAHVEADPRVLLTGGEEPSLDAASAAPPMSGPAEVTPSHGVTDTQGENATGEAEPPGEAAFDGIPAQEVGSRDEQDSSVDLVAEPGDGGQQHHPLTEPALSPAAGMATEAASTEPETGPTSRPSTEEHDGAAGAAGAASAVAQAAGPEQPPHPAEQPSADIIEQALALAADDDPHRIEATLVRELEAETDPQRQALAQYELGHLLQSRLDTEARAVKAYAQALNSDPLLRPNVWAIRRIFVARQLWPNLLKLQDAEVRFEEEPARKAEVLLEKGWIQQDQLKDVVGAAESFQAAHEVNPQWLAPLLALEKLALGANDLTLLCRLYRKMVAATEDAARRATLLQELARLEERRAGGTPQQALQILEEAYSLGQDRAGVLELMEQIALHAGLHAELIGVLRRQADELLRRAEPERRLAAAKLRLAAHVARSTLDDPGQAQNLLAAALEALPDEAELQTELLELAEDRGDWGLAATMLERQIGRQGGALARANLWHRLGLARIAAHDPRAAEAFERAREELPGFLPVLIAEERRLLGVSDLEALSRLWVSEAEAVERSAPGVLPLAEGSGPDWCAAALWRAAGLVQQLNRPDQAIEIYRRALHASPGFEPARDDLAVLLRRTGQHGALAALLEDQLVASKEDSAKLLLLEELLALYAGPIDDAEQLLATIRRLRAHSGNDRRLLRRQAEVLERLGRVAEVEETLRALEAEENDDARLCGWKLSRAALLEGPLARAEEAIPVYREVLDRMPEHPFAFAGLETLLRRLGRHEDLAALLRQTADQCPDNEEGRPRRLRLLRRLAVLQERQLARFQDALPVYAEIVAAQPADPAALRDLARVAAAAGDTARLVEALEGLIERASSPPERARLQIRLAEILEDKLSDPLRAEELQSLAVEATAPALCLDAIDALARRRIARGDHLEALRALESLQTAVPVEAAAAILEERAWLTAGPADESDRGDDLWSRVLEQQPDNRRAILARMRFGARQRRPALVAEVATQLAALGQDPATALALRLRAGTLGEAAGEPLAGAEAYTTLLRDQPTSLEAVCGLLARADLAVDERADLLAKLSAIAPDRVREDMRLHRAEICERAGRLREAVEELRPLLEKDPDHLPGLFLAQRLAEATGGREQEARCWARIGHLLTAEGPKADALSKAAELVLQLSRKDEAVVLLRHVLSLRPRDRPAYDRLRKLYEENADHKGLDDLLGHRIHYAEDLGNRVALHFERANLRLEQLSDRAGGARELLAVLRLEPRHLEALRQLSRLYDEDGNALRALELYKRYLDLVEPIPVKRPAVLRMTDLLVGLGRASEAVEICRRFLDQAPEDEEVLSRLADLYGVVKDYPHAVTMFERLGNLKPDREWRAGHLRRMGALYWHDLKDLAEARSTLLRARDLDPGNLEVLDALRQLCRQMGQFDDLKRVLERAKDDLRESLATQPDSVELYRKLMQVSEWDEDEYSLLSAMGALCALGAADDGDRELYQRRVGKGSFEPKRTVTSKIWREALTDPRAKNAYARVWDHIAEALPKLFSGLVPGDPAELGASKSSKVDRRSAGPVAAPLDRLASAFGINEYDIFRTSRDPEFIGGVDSERPALVVGNAVVTGLNPSRRFRLGRLFSLLRERAANLESLSRNQLELLFAGAVFIVRPGATFPAPTSQVEAEAKRLGKALSRKSRADLKLSVPMLIQAGYGEQDRDGELDDWIEGVLTTANRSGLLVCGDAMVAVDEMVPGLSQARSARQGQKVVQLFKDHVQAARVLAFSVGREYLTLRRELQV